MQVSPLLFFRLWLFDRKGVPAGLLSTTALTFMLSGAMDLWWFFYNRSIFLIAYFLNLYLQILEVFIDSGLCLRCGLAVLRSHF